VRVEITTGRERAPVAAARSASALAQGGREVRERLPDPGAALDEHAAALRERRGEAQRQLHLRLAYAIAREVARAARDVAQRRRNRVLVECDRHLVARADCDERRDELVRVGRRCAAEQREPRRLGRVRRERRARGGESRAAGLRVGGEPRDHAQRVHRVRERPVPLGLAEERARERVEPEVGRIGVRDREEVLRVEVGRARELAADPAREEVPLELGVVRDDRAAEEQRAQPLAHLVEQWRVRDRCVRDAGEPLDGGRDQHAGIHERRDPVYDGSPGIGEEHADLDDARARLGREPGRLEVDDRDRPDAREPRAERRDVDGGDLERECAARRRSRPCSCDPGESSRSRAPACPTPPRGRARAGSPRASRSTRRDRRAPRRPCRSACS
jgi:hypothetical protein